MKKETAEYLVYMSFGYLVHDFIDLVVNERSARIIELLFHHLVVIGAFLVTFLSAKFLYIIVFGLIMEVNSIFLHTRSLMNLYRVSKESTSFKIVALLNLATFVLFRLSVSVALIGWLFYHYFAGEVVWYMLVINSLILYSLFITNVVLFYRVLAADGLLGGDRARPDGTSRGDDTTNSRGNNQLDEAAIEDDEDELMDEEEDVEQAKDTDLREATMPSNQAHNHSGTTTEPTTNLANGQQLDQANNVFVLNVTEH